MTLPVYTGLTTVCPKCDQSGATAGYHADNRGNAVCPDQEHMDRVCNTCQYVWQEAAATPGKVGRKKP